MERMRIDQDRLIQEVRDGKISEAKARKEITILNNLMEKLRKTIDRLSTNIERRKSAMNPRLGRGPGRRQSGAINPEVFIEGFKKIAGVAGKGLRLVAQGSRDKLSVYAYNPETREIVGRATFVPTRGGLLELKDRNLYSAGTEVEPSFQRQGIATDMQVS